MTRFLMLLALAGLVGCKEDKPKTITVGGGVRGVPKDDVPSTAAPDAGNTNYQAGAGALQNTRQAARRTVALNDMAGLGTFITAQEVELGKMPSKAEITNALKADPNMRTVSAAVADGTIILTGTTNKSGLWAYEVEADSKGGIGLVAGRANRYSADDIKNLKQGG